MEIVVRTVADKVAKYLKQKVTQALIEQGHNINGKLKDSLEVVAQEEGNSIVITGYFSESYWKFVNKGVKSGNIPFSGTGKKGGTSKYIEGLTRFVISRGIATGTKAKSIAFAIAKVHKKKGNPTPNSKRFSKTGRRLGFVDTTIDNSKDFIFKLLSDDFEKVLNSKLNYLADKIDE